MKKDTWRIFFRTLAIGLTCTALPALLVCGIAVADKNTREIGFSGRKPVFYIEENADGSVVLSAFGDRLTVDSALVDAAGQAWQVCKTAVPHTVKTGAALIERLVDQILEPVFPTG